MSSDESDYDARKYCHTFKMPIKTRIRDKKDLTKLELIKNRILYYYRDETFFEPKPLSSKFPKDLFLKIGHFWIQNREGIEKERVTAEDVIYEAFWNIPESLQVEVERRLDVECSLSKKVSQKQRTLLDLFHDNFQRENLINSNRNYFCKGGMLQRDAERYIWWLSNKAWIDFKELPYFMIPSFFKSKSKLSHEEETHTVKKALIEFVAAQKGLFEDVDWTDWSVQTSVELARFKPFQLEYLFRSEFLAMPQNIQKVIGEEMYQRYLKEDEKRHANNIEIWKRKLRMTKLLEELSKIIGQKKNTCDFFMWIRLAEKFGYQEQVLTIRKIVKTYLELQNPIKMQPYLMLCEPDTKREEQLSIRTSSLSKYYFDFVVSYFIDKGFFSDLCPKNLSLGVKSLKKVVPYLLSQTKNSMVWDALDASIFEQLKAWEKSGQCIPNSEITMLTYRENIRNHYRSFIAKHQDINSSRICNAQQIEELVIADQEEDSVQVMEIDDIPYKKPRYEDNNYAKRFPGRKFSESEWKDIVRVIVVEHVTQEDFDLQGNSLWTQVVNDSRVIHANKIEDIKNDFFKKVFPNIENYLPTNNSILDVNAERFYELWYAKAAENDTPTN